MNDLTNQNEGRVHFTRERASHAETARKLRAAEHHIERLTLDLRERDEIILRRDGVIRLLEADMRERYVRHAYGQLADRYQGILITLDYAQEQMAGPPFSVHDDEVQALYPGHSHARIIDRRDILDKEPKFAQRGVAKLDTVVYRLQGER